jgi:protoporphyrinogen oxidase
MRRKVLEWLGDDYVSIQRRSVIWSNGVYTRYPFQANTFGLPPDVAHECVMGFLEAHFAAKTPNPQNFEEFCLAHFGAGISKHFMIPYNSRLWGVHPREITSAWCQRFVPIPKLDDVIAGAVGKNARELGYNANFVYPRLGIGELPKAMHARLPHVELGRAPLRIELEERALVFEDERVEFDVLINTIPLPALLDLIADLPAEIAQAKRKLRSTHLYYLDVALDRISGKDFHWAYVPEAKYPFYRVGCYSHFSEAMAPIGKSNLYVELADRSPPGPHTLSEVTEGLVEMGVIERPSDVAFARVRRLDYAYVIFDHAYFGALDVIRPFLEQSAIISAGRYGNWNYSSMEDALIFGRDAARTARELLAR